MATKTRVSLIATVFMRMSEPVVLEKIKGRIIWIDLVMLFRVSDSREMILGGPGPANFYPRHTS